MTDRWSAKKDSEEESGVFKAGALRFWKTARFFLKRSQMEDIMKKKGIGLLLALCMLCTSQAAVQAADVSAAENTKEIAGTEQQEEGTNSDTAAENGSSVSDSNAEGLDSNKTEASEENGKKEETKPETKEELEQETKKEETKKDETKEETKKEETKKENGVSGNTVSDNTMAQPEKPKPSLERSYIALGADLSAQQRAVVLGLFGLTEADLSRYDVVYITNAEEHTYLDSYLSKSLIGSRSLSSVLVEKKDPGHGILVTTKNISYCTTGMYQNALITAGVTDADIIVAGPTSISGTAALVGAMKAYELMSGEKLSAESMDAAIDELVTTGELTDVLGDSEKAEQLIAYVKQLIVENGYTSEADIIEAVKEGADKLGVKLSEDEISKIQGLMHKISGLDLDIDSIKSQAEELYKKLEKLNESGFFAKIGQFFTNLFGGLVDFFTSLFQ